MRNLFTFLVVLFLLSACSSAPKTSEKGNTYGVEVTKDNAQSMAQLVSVMNSKNEMKAKVEGEVEAVCQKKGCWMNLKRTDGATMRVTFKDYGFFVPLDITGKNVVVEGVAKFDTTSVDILRHYAEDEGLPQEEINKITEPEIELVFVADGVLIQ